MRKQESYWSFRAPNTPEFADLPEGAFGGTEAGWNSLSPGYRREIYRSALRKAELPKTECSPDKDRLERADRKYEQGATAIMAREAL